jgi:hypothetical protein
LVGEQLTVRPGETVEIDHGSVRRTASLYPTREERLLNDVPVLVARVSDGVVRPPKHLPPMFSDLNGLSIWMAYSSLFSQMGVDEMFDHYEQMFRQA